MKGRAWEGGAGQDDRAGRGQNVTNHMRHAAPAVLIYQIHAFAALVSIS